MKLGSVADKTMLCYNALRGLPKPAKVEPNKGKMEITEVGKNFQRLQQKTFIMLDLLCEDDTTLQNLMSFL